MRPRLPAKKRKKQRTIRIDTLEWQEWNSEAADRRLTVSEFVRLAVRDMLATERGT